MANVNRIICYCEPTLVPQQTAQLHAKHEVLGIADQIVHRDGNLEREHTSGFSSVPCFCVEFDDGSYEIINTHNMAPALMAIEARLRALQVIA